MSRLEFLKVAEDLLRRRKDVFASIKGGQNLNRFLLNANLCTIFFAAIYGATMGALPGGLQILYNIIKIPLLLLISLYVALPTYYVLDAFSGGDVSLRQTASVLVSSFAIMSIVLLAFVPVNLFFILTTPGQGFSTYSFIVLLNVGIFTIAGAAGLTYQFSGMESIHTRWPGSSDPTSTRDPSSDPCKETSTSHSSNSLRKLLRDDDTVLRRENPNRCPKTAKPI